LATVAREEPALEGAMSDLRAMITDALRDVYDPCCADRGLSVVDMGLIEDVRVDGEEATVDLVLTSGWCPFVIPLLDTIKARLEDLDVLRTTDVRVIWDRAWSSDRMSAKARQRLQFLPPPNQLTGGDPAAAYAGSPPAQPTTT
jgi:metal-sulfur cluster biosynthetic enzyme